MADEVQAAVDMDPEIRGYDAPGGGVIDSENLNTTLAKASFVPSDPTSYAVFIDSPDGGSGEQVGPLGDDLRGVGVRRPRASPGADHRPSRRPPVLRRAAVPGAEARAWESPVTGARRSTARPTPRRTWPGWRRRACATSSTREWRSSRSSPGRSGRTGRCGTDAATRGRGGMSDGPTGRASNGRARSPRRSSTSSSSPTRTATGRSSVPGHRGGTARPRTSDFATPTRTWPATSSASTSRFWSTSGWRRPTGRWRSARSRCARPHASTGRATSACRASPTATGSGRRRSCCGQTT